MRRTAIVIVMVIVLAFAMPALSADLDNWILRNPRITAERLEDVAYGNGMFIAVGFAGTILTSADGYAWQQRDAGIASNLYTVAYGAGRFVASGASGLILISADGIVWNEYDAGTGLNDLADLAYTGSGFVGVGSSGIGGTTISGVSVLGDTWFTVPVSGANLHTVTYANDTSVAAGYGGILTSPDGLSWTTATNSLNGTASGYFKGRFLVGTIDGRILTSSDGTIWQSAVTGISSPIYALHASPDIAVAAGGSGKILTSTNATDWTEVSSGSSLMLRGIAYGRDTFVAVGSSGTILASSNCIDWVDLSGGMNDRSLSGLASGNGKLVAAGGDLMVSSDGKSWTNIPFKSNLLDVAYGSGTFVAVGQCHDPTVDSTFSNASRSVIITSTNGLDWTDRSTGIYVSLLSVSYVNGLFIAIGGSDALSYMEGLILTSADGTTWTRRSSPLHGRLVDCAASAGTYLISTSKGRVITSSDAVTWTAPFMSFSHSDPAEDNAYLAYGSPYFMLASENGDVYRSTEGLSWSPVRSFSTDPNIAGLEYIDSKFILLGGGFNGMRLQLSLISGSTSGLEWTDSSIRSAQTLGGAVLHADSIFLSGSGGMILEARMPVTRYVSKIGLHVYPYTAAMFAATNIQAAVDAAEQGDTVIVADGIYAEGSTPAPGCILPNRVMISNAITVVSQNGPDNTVITGRGPRGTNAIRCVYLCGDAILSGFALTGGCTLKKDDFGLTIGDEDLSAGGIYAPFGVITNCIVTGCSATASGGGAVCRTMYDCTVTHNNAVDGGAGVVLKGGELRNSTIAHNIGSAGSGVYAEQYSLVTGCTVVSNTSQNEDGAGLWCTRTTVRDSISSHNRSTASNSWSRGGGIYCLDGSLVEDCTANSNTMPYANGGGIYAHMSTIRRCTIIGNYVDDDDDDLGDGGGVFAGAGTLLDDCRIYSNAASENGSGAYCVNAVITNCTIDANIRQPAVYCGEDGLVIDCLVASNFVGGIYCRSGTIRNSSVIGNYGHIVDNDPGIFCREGLVEGCVVLNNTAGGIECSTGGRAIDCYVAGNVASSGGGIRCDGGTVEACTVVGNTAQDGAGIYVFTGPGQTSTVQNSVVYGNWGTNGAGIWAQNEARIFNCTIAGNTATETAGGLYCESGAVVANTIIYSNTAVSDPNYLNLDTGLSYSSCCADPMPPGPGNLAAHPAFVGFTAGDLSLAPWSPCVEAGTNLESITRDINGWSRPLDGNNDGASTLDIGAHEYLNGLADSDGDGLTDSNEVVLATDPGSGDTDKDGLADGDELAADTDPRNAQSLLRLTKTQLSPTAIDLRWQGGTAATQYLEYAPSLSSVAVWTPVLTNSPPTSANGSIVLQMPGQQGYYRLRIAP